MLIVVGFLLILIGVIALLFGDREVGNQRAGGVLRSLSWPAGKATWLKIPMGVVLISVGILVVLRGMPS